MTERKDKLSFEALNEKYNLHDTDHERVKWVSECWDDRAMHAAEHIANAFPDMMVVGQHSRILMHDVKYRVSDDGKTLLVAFYPLRARKRTHKVIDDIREYRRGIGIEA